MLDYFISLQETEDLMDNYYTPFIKSKLNDKTEYYKKEIKRLDKELDKIKTAYIKGITKLEDFDSEIKHIKARQKELQKQLSNQEEYNNLSFTLDDLLIFQDKQRVDLLTNPSDYLNLLTNWLLLSKEKEKDIISHYVDYIEIDKIDDKYQIVGFNVLKSYVFDLIDNYVKYSAPAAFKLFIQGKDKIPVDLNIKTDDEAKEYFNKLQRITKTTTDCDLKYREIYFDVSSGKKEIKMKKNERLVRIILLKGKPEDKYSNNTKLGVITIDLDKVKDLYSKEYLDFISNTSDEYRKTIRNKLQELYNN